MRRLPKRLTGTGKMESWLNELRDAVQERTPLRSHRSLLIRQREGFRTIPIGEEDVSGNTSTSPDKLFSIALVHAEYLECYEITFPNDVKTLSQDITLVAKPEYLRAVASGNFTFPDGIGNSRQTTKTVGTVPGVVIDEELVPIYEVGKEIVATNIDSGVNVTAFVDGNTERLTWEDVNADGRKFRMLEKVINVCIKIGGVDTLRKMVVYGTEPFA